MTVLAWPARSNADRNPYQRLLYDALEEQNTYEVQEFSPVAPFLNRSYKILHLHWPDAFLAADTNWKFWLRLLYLYLLAYVVKLRGAKLVWTVHNLQRENQRNGQHMARFFWPWFLRRVDGVIYMTQASAEQARESTPELVGTPTAIIPHGHYLPVINPVSDQAPKASENPNETPSILFFGSITSYKNVWKVLESFLELPPGQARLEICGRMSHREPDTKLQDALNALPTERQGEVTFDDRFLSDEELVERLRQADLVVFPYSGVLNSGAAIFALSANTPLLASDNALFRELRDIVGADWVSLINNPLDGPQLTQALHHARALRSHSETPNLTALDWPKIAQQTAAFYNELADQKAHKAAELQ